MLYSGHNGLCLQQYSEIARRLKVLLLKPAKVSPSLYTQLKLKVTQSDSCKVAANFLKTH